MVNFRPKNQSRVLTDDQFPENLYYRYPCTFAKSKDMCDIIVEVTREPKDNGSSEFYSTGNYPITMETREQRYRISNPIALNTLLNNTYLPTGTYHLECVSCSCPSFLTKIQHTISSIFRKKTLQTNHCRVHNKNFDVYLRSNQSLSFLGFRSS